VGSGFQKDIVPAERITSKAASQLYEGLRNNVKSARASELSMKPHSPDSTQGSKAEPSPTLGQAYTDSPNISTSASWSTENKVNWFDRGLMQKRINTKVERTQA
jgi:hypothetical protein